MASRHSGGTTSFRQPVKRRPPLQHPRLTTHGRWPSRIDAGAHAPPPAADQASALEDVQHDQPVDVFLFPSQLLPIEVLRRPVESTLFLLIRMFPDQDGDR